MKRNRSRNFIITIIVGILLGLALGWLVIKPKAPQNVNITRLRPDFQADAVLMVAESFAVDGDQMLALDRLARLDHGGDLLTFVGKALQNAQAYGYADEDLAQMQKLLEGLDLVVYENWKILRGRND